MKALRSVWDSFQNEILGMAWLNRLLGSILNSFDLDTSEKIGGSVLFFIYDMILLGVLIFIMFFYIQKRIVLK